MSQKIRQDINIGKNIRALRIRSGYTQEQTVAKLQLAGIHTMSRSIYSQIEAGTYNIRVSELAALKIILKADSYDAFFAGLTESEE